MKKLLIILSGITASAYLYTLVIVVSGLLSGCTKETAIDALKPTGWNSTEYVETESGDLNATFKTTGAFCSSAPQDATINVWYGDPKLNGDDYTGEIQNPGKDADGDDLDMPDPDDEISVSLSFLENGKKSSNYGADGKFTLMLEPNQLAVFQVIDAKGKETWSHVVTTSAVKSICFGK